MHLASAGRHCPHFTDVTAEPQNSEATCQRPSQDLNPDLILPAHHCGVPRGDPQLPKGCQEVAGEARLFGIMTRGPDFRWSHGSQPWGWGLRSGLQAAESVAAAWKPCVSHGDLASYHTDPILFSGHSQLSAYTLGISGGLARTTFTFRRNLPPVTGMGTELDLGPLHWAGAAGNSTGGSSINIPLTRHVLTPEAALLTHLS